MTDSYVLRVDGAEHRVVGAPQSDSLVQVLRDRLGLTATKDGCNQGRCGSCSVLMDGVLVTSCTVLAVDAVDAEVTTVAGLGGDTEPGTPRAPGAVQRALVEAGAVQCGFCTPGMAVAITDLLARQQAPSDPEIRLALSGNLCRCTGYGRIVAAVRRLAPESV